LLRKIKVEIIPDDFNLKIKLIMKCLLGFLVFLFLFYPVDAQEIEHTEYGFQDFSTEKEYTVTAFTREAIQAAIDKAHTEGGGIVWLEPGVYEITQDINLKSNVKLVGKLNADSTLAVTIRARNAMYQALVVARNDVVQNTTVENLIIDGGGYDHHGISYIYGTDNFLVSNNEIINIGYEKVPCANNGRAGNPTAINMWSEGDDFTDNFTIRGNRICSVALHGINVNNGRNFILQNNYVEKAFMGWDASEGSSNGEILGNEVVDCIFGAKTHNGENLYIHHNDHHNLDDTPYYFGGTVYNNSGTAMVFQGPQLKDIVAEYNNFSGTTAAKAIAYWDIDPSRITLKENTTSPSGPGLTAVNAPEKISGSYLMQNFPNPFHNTTCISFTLPAQEKVFLYVYDLLGNKISTLVDGIKDKGTYKIIFNASFLDAGCYFYRLTAGTICETQSMIYLKNK